MAADEIIEISLLSGRSDRPTLTFTPGTPTNPVSVGTAGQWVVSGEGVEPVHVYLFFDGRHAYAALAAANADVRLAGARLGPDWVRAPVPCELRFGGACLILRYAPRVTQLQEERTVHDGGALWHAAQAAQRAGAPFPAVRPAAGAPSNLNTTLPLKGSPVRGPEPVEEATTLRDPTLGAPAPAPPIAQEVTRIAPQPLMPRAVAPEPARPAEPPPAAGQVAPAPSAASAAATDALAYWRSASFAKKATLVLLPFALIASYILFQPDSPPPPAAKSVAANGGPGRGAAVVRDASAASAGLDLSAGGADSGSVGSSAGVASMASSDGHQDAPPKLAPLPPGKRTPERLALDAVAAGSFDEASRLYAALATSHPDDPSYKEAARILREKTGNPR